MCRPSVLGSNKVATLDWRQVNLSGRVGHVRAASIRATARPRPRAVLQGPSLDELLLFDADVLSDYQPIAYPVERLQIELLGGLCRDRSKCLTPGLNRSERR
jgi:hypothetical protein